MMRKKIIEIFQQVGFQIEIVTGLKSANFLDITLNLNTATYQPYKKPNDTLLYVHTSSNHPQQILQQLPKAIAERLSKNSSSEAIFEKAKSEYEEALKKSGYKNCSLEYKKTTREPR